VYILTAILRKQANPKNRKYNAVQSSTPLYTHCLENNYPRKHCSGSVIFWYGSGSKDPYLLLRDPGLAPDPAIFVSDLQDPNKKKKFLSQKGRSERAEEEITGRKK
jgi:hypothetical protein